MENEREEMCPHDNICTNLFLQWGDDKQIWYEHYLSFETRWCTMRSLWRIMSTVKFNIQRSKPEVGLEATDAHNADRGKTNGGELWWLCADWWHFTGPGTPTRTTKCPSLVWLSTVAILFAAQQARCTPPKWQQKHWPNRCIGHTAKWCNPTNESWFFVVEIDPH